MLDWSIVDPMHRAVLGIVVVLLLPGCGGATAEPREADTVTDDACPDAEEDVDGFEDDDGCPDEDNDADGIVDRCDDCPNDPETVNGWSDRDGCPDEPPASTSSSITTIEERVAFAAGSSEIAQAEMPTVDAVATLLRGAPDVLRVAVVGHAAQGEPTSLASERAEAARRTLIERGLEADRLEARAGGAGPREVSFEIVERQPDDVPAQSDDVNRCDGEAGAPAPSSR